MLLEHNCICNHFMQKLSHFIGISNAISNAVRRKISLIWTGVSQTQFLSCFHLASGRIWFKLWDIPLPCPISILPRWGCQSSIHPTVLPEPAFSTAFPTFHFTSLGKSCGFWLLWDLSCNIDTDVCHRKKLLLMIYFVCLCRTVSEIS